MLISSLGAYGCSYIDCTTHRQISTRKLSESGFVIVARSNWMSSPSIRARIFSSDPLESDPEKKEDLKEHYMQSNNKVNGPKTIAASYRTFSGARGSFRIVIRRGTIPCDMTIFFCLSLPMTTFFKQINDSCTLPLSSLLYKSSIYDREFSTSCNINM